MEKLKMKFFDPNDDDVVIVNESTDTLLRMDTVAGFFEQIDRISRKNPSEISSLLRKFVESGVKVKFLRTEGGGWKEGMIRLRYEFLIEETETNKPGESERAAIERSPLDDLRSELSIE